MGFFSPVKNWLLNIYQHTNWSGIPDHTRGIIIKSGITVVFQNFSIVDMSMKRRKWGKGKCLWMTGVKIASFFQCVLHFLLRNRELEHMEHMATHPTSHLTTSKGIFGFYNWGVLLVSSWKKSEIPLSAQASPHHRELSGLTFQ